MLFPRCYLVDVEEEVTSCSLQGFCDASIKAYAAVIYLKVETLYGVYVRFVTSKSRVSPLERQSILRLELLSALLLARLIDNVERALKSVLTLGPSTCWTDSKVSLYWITQLDKEWKQFIQNRVNEIRKLTPISSWKHCPGHINPADIPSRGMTPTDMVKCELWNRGPAMLHEKVEEEEHRVLGITEIPEECIEEMKIAEQRKLENNTQIALLAVEGENGVAKIINCDNFSSFRRLVRVTARVLKFIKILKTKCKSRELTADDVKEAELLWLKEIQLSLKRNPKYECWKRQFGLFNDGEEVLRCGGRISNVDIRYETKHPVMLDRNHRATQLIIEECHERVQHNGVKETLTELRSNFWVVKGRQFVRKIIHSCAICRRFEGKSYNPPDPPPLPKSRVTEDPPFACTGIDFAGPLYVQNEDKMSTEMAKVWICLYTCGVTRAVHLELVREMTTEAFLRSFKRFTARRGVPAKVISDNAKTFISAAKKLSALFDLPEVKGYLSSRKIEWSFNLEKAPWWGGFFERLVKSMKRCLKKVLKNSKVTFDELLTVVTEVEAILNSRPISYVSSEDIEEPLTPSHLLCGRRLLSLPNAISDNGKDDPDWQPNKNDLNRKRVHLESLIGHFWKRWHNEYLLELRESHRLRLKGTSKRQVICVGDVVVVRDDTPRVSWRIGRVEGLIEGEDHQVRGATIRMSSKGMKPSRLRRPIQALIPLEINDGGDEDLEETRDLVGRKEESTMAETRPRRKTAVAADAIRREWIQHELSENELT